MSNPEDRRKFTHRWHVAINAFMVANRKHFSEHRFMYDAMNLFEEIPRLQRLFSLERTGGLPKTHRQCSHSSEESVPENHLTCCLGVRCSRCPMLIALDEMEATPEKIDEAKAWTCAGHIVSKGGDPAGEGFILTVGDKMFWDRVYESLASPPPQ